MPTSPQEPRPADLRRCFLRAVQLSEQPECDRGAVGQLLLRCVTSDPGNLIFVEAFLGNLGEMHDRRSKPKPGFRLRRAIEKAESREDWQPVFRLGPQLLAGSPWHVPTLLAMAQACESLHYEEVGLRYLSWALAARPEHVEVNRRCGRWLARLGRFDEALVCWQRVEESLAGDEEACRMIAQLSEPAAHASHEPQRQLEAAIQSNPGNASNYLELSDSLLAEKRFAEAQEVLHRAHAACGVNLQIQQRLEDLQLAHAEHQMQVAQRQTDNANNHTESVREQLAANLNRVELEVFRRRVERYPENNEYRFRLAETLAANGNFAEAAKYFEQSATDDRLAAASFLHLGECQQRMRRFERALSCYRQAIQANNDQPETAMLALYRHGVLAMAMDLPDEAERSFEQLVQLDPNYRDATARLDKLRQIGHK